MKVILDFRKYDGVVGGVEQGAIQIARYMIANGHEVILTCKENRETQVRELFASAGEGLTIQALAVTTHAIRKENEEMDSGFLPDLASATGASLIHFYYNWSFPERKTVPTLLTVHDVIPFTFREAMSKYDNEHLYRPAMKRACALNDLIATVSEFSRQDIAAKVGVPLDKIRVIPNGLREPYPKDPDMEVSLSERWGLANGFVLNCGGIHERKNIPRLIEAFAQLVQEDKYPGKLVITGSVSGAPYQEEMKKICDEAVQRYYLDDRVIFSGFVSEEELDSLLRMAGCFIYPSLYEGFGIPILEAMKVGTPVVCSNVTAMPEVAGDAALLVNPEDVDDMAGAIRKILQDEPLRNGLVAKGRQRAAPYSWDNTCSQYLEIYEKLGQRS